MKVLIVDDSKIVCEGLQQMLINIADVEVVGQANDAQDAITAILEYEPDVVILDIRLPGLSGIDVLKDIRAKNLSSLVIMLTNYPYPQYRKICKELGADYFFDKVTEIEEIPILIEELAKNKHENMKKGRNKKNESIDPAC
ncbi:MAG: response regulator transcription factor [Desulfobacterales bacterium]|nr:response regulator transcription factor [Desulfobacterales bacterium]